MNIEELEKIWQQPNIATYKVVLENFVDFCDAIGGEGISDYTEVAGMLRHIADEKLRELQQEETCITGKGSSP